MSEFKTEIVLTNGHRFQTDASIQEVVRGLKVLGKGQAFMDFGGKTFVRADHILLITERRVEP